tara:strand:+ start:286 stop:1815 length:1530 start_codon:yes stop_codon:yes gene_type:complete
MSQNMSAPSLVPDRDDTGATSGAQESMVEREAVGPNVPNLLRVSPMDTTTATDVETSILDPVVSSDSFVRFTLLNKGILHSHSKITLAVTSPTDGVDRYFPVSTGIHSLISRCALKVGTKTIQEIDGYNTLSAYKRLFMSNEHQFEREQILSGNGLAHEFRYNDSTSGSLVATNNTEAFRYGLKTGLEYDDVFGTTTGNVVLPEFLEVNVDPVFQIALADLFPLLKQTQLPLYMMQEQVSIELTFEPVQQKRVSIVNGGDTTQTIAIDTNQVKFIADYIYYPQEMMTTYAQSNPIITMNHFDYRHSAVTVTSANASGSTLIRNLGGAGRIVTKVITGLQSAATGQVQMESVTNQFHSISPERHYSFGQAPAATNFNGSLTVNVKYNDKFLYPIDVTNPARQFHNTAQAEGMVPFVSREEFSAEGVSVTPDTYYSSVQNSGDAADEDGIVGRFNWMAFRLNRNERVNTRGIEYYYKYEGLNAAAPYVQRSWLELAKVTTLANGFITTALL